MSRSFGNTSGSNEALTVGNAAQTLADYDYDTGYNAFDVRHTFTLGALYNLPYGRGRAHPATGLADVLLGGWDIGGIVNARSGLPIDVRITRPDVVYVDGGGTVFNNPALGRTALINTPNGGASRNVRRPDLVAGVDPFVASGGSVFLNPAAFATPKPGTYGNLERGSLHGPKFNQVDLVLAKHFPFRATMRNAEFRIEVFNVFDQANFSNPVATLPSALPTKRRLKRTKCSPVRASPGQPPEHSERSPEPSAVLLAWARRVRCSSRSGSTFNEEDRGDEPLVRSVARILETRSRTRAGSFFALLKLRPPSLYQGLPGCGTDSEKSENVRPQQ